MRKLGILLVLATIVVAGCKSGKQTDGKGENEVDSALQVKVEAALLEGMKDCRADSGLVVVMDIENDAIVAMHLTETDAIAVTWRTLHIGNLTKFHQDMPNRVLIPF